MSPARRERTRLPLLSKSRYVSGVQCDKRLYLECLRPGVAGETSAAQQYLFRQGHEVGALATLRYPGGVRIEYDRADHAAAAAATSRALADPSVPAIFEGAFEHAGVRIRVNILVRRPGGWWRVEEVKSTTRVKDVHLEDLAVQLFVLEGCGLRVGAAGIVVLDREYVRTTSAIDVHALFRFTDLRKLARAGRREVAANLRRWRRQLARRSPPEIAPGRQCFDPHQCPFTDPTASRRRAATRCAACPGIRSWSRPWARSSRTMCAACRRTRRSARCRSGHSHA